MILGPRPRPLEAHEGYVSLYRELLSGRRGDALRASAAAR
jgi:hypothetical protein